METDYERDEQDETHSPGESACFRVHSCAYAVSGGNVRELPPTGESGDPEFSRAGGTPKPRNFGTAEVKPLGGSANALLSQMGREGRFKVWEAGRRGVSWALRRF
jgi:hypothetical protein